MSLLVLGSKLCFFFVKRRKGTLGGGVVSDGSFLGIFERTLFHLRGTFFFRIFNVFEEKLYWIFLRLNNSKMLGKQNMFCFFERKLILKDLEVIEALLF